MFSVPTLAPRRATLGTVRDAEGRAIDAGLALFFPAPASYTGEDVVEFHVHGSTAVARETLLGALAAGARLATPGEFTRRAFLAGKLDLSAAEAVADLTLEEIRRAELVHEGGRGRVPTLAEVLAFARERRRARRGRASGRWPRDRGRAAPRRPA